MYAIYFPFHSQNGLTALQVAAGCGNMEVVQVLVKAGANIHAVDDVSTFVHFTSKWKRSALGGRDS